MDKDKLREIRTPDYLPSDQVGEWPRKKLSNIPFNCRISYDVEF